MATSDSGSPFFCIANRQYNFVIKQVLGGVFSNSNAIYSGCEGDILKINNIEESDIAKLQLILNGLPMFATEYAIVLDDVTVTLADVTPNATFRVRGLNLQMNNFIQYNQVNGVIISENVYPNYTFTPFYNKYAPTVDNYFLIPGVTDDLSRLDECVIRTLGHVKYYNLVFKFTDQLYVPKLV